jgi:Protein of unknown function (DUF2934)
MFPPHTHEPLSLDPPVSTPRPRPDHAEIASLAFALWHQRGCPDGSPEEDWFRAEREVLTHSEA